MKFFETPAQLGLDYHGFTEITFQGEPAVRYVLSKNATPDQLKEIEKYENLKYVPNGATYKYAPEIKYPVLYVIGKDEEGAEEVAEEADVVPLTDEETIHADGDEVISSPEDPVDDYTPDSNTKLAMVNAVSSETNSLIMAIDNLEDCFPEYTDLFTEMKGNLANMLGQLQGLMTKIPEIGDKVSDGLEETVNSNAEITDTAVEETTGKSMDEEAAYNWFNGVFYKFIDSMVEKDPEGMFNPTEEEMNSFKSMLDNSPYDRNLLGWIWANLAELNDDGYEYPVFVSLCGHYKPIEGYDFSEYPDKEVPDSYWFDRLED